MYIEESVFLKEDHVKEVDIERIKKQFKTHRSAMDFDAHFILMSFHGDKFQK